MTAECECPRRRIPQLTTKDGNGVQSATLRRTDIPKFVYYFNYLGGPVRKPHRISDPLCFQQWRRTGMLAGVQRPRPSDK